MFKLKMNREKSSYNLSAPRIEVLHQLPPSFSTAQKGSDALNIPFPAARSPQLSITTDEEARQPTTTGCSPPLSGPLLSPGSEIGHSSHGQAQQVQRRRGGVLPAGRRRHDDGEPAASVGLHPQGVRDRLPAAAADGGRRRGGQPGGPHRGLLPRPHHGHHRRHHRRHRRPLPRHDSDDHLPEAAPDQPGVAGALHRVHQLRRGADLPVEGGARDTGGGGDHHGGGAGAHRLHLLGGQARPRLRVPGAIPGGGHPHPDALRPRADPLPAGEDGDHGVRLRRRARLLRLHHLRHRQPHQALRLRRVRRRRHRALPRHHQPLPGHSRRHRRRRLITIKRPYSSPSTDKPAG